MSMSSARWRGYYPSLSRRQVPGAGHRLSIRAVLGAVLLVIVAIVVLSSLAVSNRPTPKNCHFFCGSTTAPALVPPTVYRSSTYGFTIEYLPDSTQLKDQSAGAATFETPNGVIFFEGSSGSDLDGSIRLAVLSLNSSAIQDLQEVGPVRGAEIGLVPAHGQAYTANFVSQSGAAAKVGILVMAAAQDGVTVTATMVSVYYTQNDSRYNNYQPYGLIDGPLFDYPITALRFKGQS